MSSYVENIANIGFLLLFPGFFLWHFGLATGVLPSHIGLYGEVSALLAVAFMTLFAMRWVTVMAKSPFAVITIALLIYCLFWIGIHAIGSPPPGSVAQSVVVLVHWFALLSVGVFMNAHRRIFQKVLILGWISMAAITIYYLDGLQFIARQAFNAAENTASYQGFSRSVMISSIFLLAFSLSAWRRYLFSIISIVFVFVMAARSELYGLIFAIATVETVYALRRPKYILLFALIGLALALVAIWNLDYLSQSRQLQVLNLSEASSWIARTYFSAFAWNQILESPLLGNFGGHYFASQDGSLGSYAHSVVSAWVNFGLLGFILYLGLTVWAFAASIIGFYRTEDWRWQISLYLNASAFILIIFAKSVFWPMVALGWGFFIRQSMSARHASRHVRHRSRHAAALAHP